MTQEGDPGQCPLCSEENDCALAAGRPPEDCWCWRQAIPAAVLQRVSEADRGQRCVCPHCASPTGEQLER